MIETIYQMSCDFCGLKSTPENDQNTLEKKAINFGWVRTEDRSGEGRLLEILHFCPKCKKRGAM